MSDANEPKRGSEGNGVLAEESGASAISRDGLRLVSLAMENIGPFDTGEIEFATGGDGAPAVTILTGENGTGKTIVLDAIRGMFGAAYAKPESAPRLPPSARSTTPSVGTGRSGNTS